MRAKSKEEATFQFIKGLLKMGMDADSITQTFDLPKTKVEEIIAKL